LLLTRTSNFFVYQRSGEDSSKNVSLTETIGVAGRGSDTG
jgi:hypothetical protein